MGLHIAVGIAVAALALVAYAATRPSTFEYRRSATVKASPAKIFPLVDDFRHWATWSPWEKLDPGMKRAHSGAHNGDGAIYEWSGTGKAGAGRMEIAQSLSPSKITINLDFIRPFETHNIAEFTFARSGDATDVTWAMRGPSPLLMRVVGVFTNMDKIVGKDFEAGLANLKTAVEK